MFKNCVNASEITKMKDPIPIFKPSFSKDTTNFYLIKISI